MTNAVGAHVRIAQSVCGSINKRKEFNMEREEQMIAEYEALMNTRFSDQDRALMVSAMKWADSHPVNQWHKVEDELPPRRSEDSHQSLVVIISDGFDFEKAYYDYFYDTWWGNNITPMYWMRLLKPEE